MGRGGIYPRILELGVAGIEQPVISASRMHHLRYQMDKRLGEHQSRCGTCGEYLNVQS